MNQDDYIVANRDAWNEAAALHRRQNQAELLETFSKGGYSCLLPKEKEILENLGMQGLSVAQLGCNNGRELISVKNMGAGLCVGFDQSEEFVQQARELNEAAGQDCRFVVSPIHEISKDFDRTFDLVFVTIGVLGWMPDLDQFMARAAEILRPGGRLFLSEQHPILWMIEPGKAGDPLVWELSYFDKAPYKDSEGLDYYGGGTYESKPLYSFQHKMSDIFSSAIGAGLGRIEHFEESPEHISNTWWNVEECKLGFPMSFTLLLRKD